jgi:hypothetical protein
MIHEVLLHLERNYFPSFTLLSMLGVLTMLAYICLS